MEAQEGTGWERSYLCIDLKSFYASCECVERGLDPMTTDLVVADPERSDRTICLAVSPSLKAKGVRNRCRVFQIPQGMEYIMAPPRMALYIRYSARIYQTMLRFVSEDDIHVYSIDEAFLDVTGYLAFHKCSARQLGERIRQAILQDTGIPATCGWVATCIWPRWRWTSPPSTAPTSSASWTNRAIRPSCGTTAPSPTSGA